MSELESLALLIADLNAQVRALQAENAALKREQANVRETPHGPVTETPA